MSIRCKINRNGETLGVLPLSDEERQDILAVIHDEKILNTIVNSFLAITENLSEVVDNEYEKGHFKEEDIDEIKVDLADSYDEFVIYHNAKQALIIT